MAHIRGQLSLSGAHLANPGGDALAADDITVDGSMSCREGFRAEGTIRLTSAHLGSQLSFTGATLSQPSGPALSCESMRVDSLCCWHFAMGLEWRAFLD